MTARLEVPTGNTADAFDAYAEHVTAKGRKIGHNTSARLEADDRGCSVVFRYHRTDIAEWRENGFLILNTGGWRTVTTKDRLNTLGRALGFRVWSHDYVWQVSDRATGERAFYDGVTTLGSRLCVIGCECGAR